MDWNRRKNISSDRFFSMPFKIREIVCQFIILMHFIFKCPEQFDSRIVFPTVDWNCAKYVRLWYNMLFQLISYICKRSRSHICTVRKFYTQDQLIITIIILEFFQTMIILLIGMTKGIFQRFKMIEYLFKWTSSSFSDAKIECVFAQSLFTKISKVLKERCIICDKTNELK